MYKLTIKTQEQRQLWTLFTPFSCVLVADSEHVTVKWEGQLEVYLGPCQVSMMKLLWKKVNGRPIVDKSLVPNA